MYKIGEKCYLLLCKDYKLLKLLFIIITLYLICGQFYTYLVLKPTLTFQTSRKLNSEDFPEMLFCPKPSVDVNAVFSRGYQGKDHYNWGINSYHFDNQKQIGWAGNKSETLKKVSEEISILKSAEDCPNYSSVWGKESLNNGVLGISIFAQLTFDLGEKSCICYAFCLGPL